jgi:uncharacterized membrane protein
VYAGVVAIAAVLVAAVVAAPWLASHGHPVAGAVLREGFSKVCHQMPERSFWLFGAPMAVCSRCAALYAGGLLGVLVVPLVRGVTTPAPSRVWFAAALAPAVADFALGSAGIVENTFWSRGVTGLASGAAAAFYILPGLVDAAMELLAGARPSSGGAHGPG